MDNGEGGQGNYRKEEEGFHERSHCGHPLESYEGGSEEKQVTG